MTPRSAQDFYVGFAHEVLSPTGTAVGFTAATYAPADNVTAQLAVCTVETQAIRYWTDGQDPTASEGIMVAAGGSFVIGGRGDIKGFRAIAVTGSPKIMVQFKR
jgi:hypothetical protein